MRGAWRARVAAGVRCAMDTDALTREFEPLSIAISKNADDADNADNADNADLSRRLYNKRAS